MHRLRCWRWSASNYSLVDSVDRILLRLDEWPTPLRGGPLIQVEGIWTKSDVPLPTRPSLKDRSLWRELLLRVAFSILRSRFRMGGYERPFAEWEEDMKIALRWMTAHPPWTLGAKQATCRGLIFLANWPSMYSASQFSVGLNDQAAEPILLANWF